ncbi:hypothetical protein NQ317_009866 [Molorchus minor]|uniref:GYF domain-containing protein n=1 Tax=Molorchus minor TaxID=1323400 RepID=A0ABQ9K4V7_9CUCU|nr:hypothetical protein NQ317_009866 [Molorchus minor]
MLEYMNPRETVNKALKRLAGDDMKLSSVERLKRKKAGTLNTNEGVTKLTELANQILTKLGNMDVYQETYEQIKGKVDNKENKNKMITKEAELDMYADDFGDKEKGKIQTGSQSNIEEGKEKRETHTVITWEFKWKIEDEEIQGPYSTNQMIKWSKEDYFKGGVMIYLLKIVRVEEKRQPFCRSPPWQAVNTDLTVTEDRIVYSVQWSSHTRNHI